MKLYQKLAQLLDARNACMGSDNPVTLEWARKHAAEIERLCKEHMPHGSGLDAGTSTQLLLDESDSEAELVFPADFHHMDEYGFYDGWTHHKVKVRPSLRFGFVLRVTGEDQNDIKDYIAEVFSHALKKEVG